MKYYLLSYSRKKKYSLLIVDFFVVFAAIITSYMLRLFINGQAINLETIVDKLTPWLLIVILAHIFSLYILDLYNINRLVSKIRLTLLIICSVIIAGILIGTIFFFLPKYIFGRQVLLIHIFVVSVFLSNWRILFNKWSIKNQVTSNLAYVGTARSFSLFISEVEDRLQSGVQITHIFSEDPPAQFSSLGDGSVKFHDSLESLLRYGSFDILIFDVLMKNYGNREIMEFMKLKHQGKTVFDLPSLIKNIAGKISLELIDGNWVVYQQGMQGQVGRMYIRCKRFFDIIGSLTLLFLMFPLFIIVAALIKFDSKGPVIFRQKRLGRHKMPFNCLKFRSMVENAEKESGPVWAGDQDSRITRVGKIIRKSRLDEIPQLINILKGELSFIGPRPIRKHFADKLAEDIPFYDLRFAVQPGLSGWAQVNHSYANTVEGQRKKFEYELFYIQNLSLFLDVIVAMKTIQSLLKYDGK